MCVTFLFPWDLLRHGNVQMWKNPDPRLVWHIWWEECALLVLIITNRWKSTRFFSQSSTGNSEAFHRLVLKLCSASVDIRCIFPLCSVNMFAILLPNSLNMWLCSSDVDEIKHVMKTAAVCLHYVSSRSSRSCGGTYGLWSTVINSLWLFVIRVNFLHLSAFGFYCTLLLW